MSIGVLIGSDHFMTLLALGTTDTVRTSSLRSITTEKNCEPGTLTLNKELLMKDTNPKQKEVIIQPSICPGENQQGLINIFNFLEKNENLLKLEVNNYH